jgi:hypothetical protein
VLGNQVAIAAVMLCAKLSASTALAIGNTVSGCPLCQYQVRHGFVEM